jgi:hypothetical protein
MAFDWIHDRAEGLLLQRLDPPVPERWLRYAV